MVFKHHPRLVEVRGRGHQLVTLTTCIHGPFSWQRAQRSRNVNHCLEGLWKTPSIVLMLSSLYS